MKFNKLAALGLAGVMTIATAVPFVAESVNETATEAATEAELENATYTLYNVTGETITELYFTEHERATEEATTEAATEAAEAVAEVESESEVAEEKVNILGDEVLADGDVYELSIDVPADETESKEYTLQFVTESGYVGTFSTLHFETVPIQLIAEDAMSGATQIAFGAPEVATEASTEA